MTELGTDASDHQVAHLDQLAAATDRVTFDRRDQRLGAGGQPVAAAGKILGQHRGEIDAAHLGDVSAGAEHLAAGEHDRGDRGITFQLIERGGQCPDHFAR